MVENTHDVSTENIEQAKNDAARMAQKILKVEFIFMFDRNEIYFGIPEMKYTKYTLVYFVVANTKKGLLMLKLIPQ